ncbi:hypothetical protein AB1E19_007587 [Capra hircus]
MMPGPTPSGPNVGSSGHSPSKARKNASCGRRSTGRATSAGTGGMWRFYTEDLPGLKVGPVPVLVMSLLFIVSVFMLHSLIDSATSICLSSEEGKNPNIF